jgi:hypothetical protein
MCPPQNKWIQITVILLIFCLTPNFKLLCDGESRRTQRSQNQMESPCCTLRATACVSLIFFHSFNISARSDACWLFAEVSASILSKNTNNCRPANRQVQQSLRTVHEDLPITVVPGQAFELSPQPNAPPSFATLLQASTACAPSHDGTCPCQLAAAQHHTTSTLSHNAELKVRGRPH